MSEIEVKTVEKKLSDNIILRLTTYGDEDRGGLVQVIDTEYLDETDGPFKGGVVFDGYFMYKITAEETYRNLTTSGEAVNWAWRNS